MKRTVSESIRLARRLQCPVVMLNATRAPKFYTLLHTIVVDHPERRDDSFAPVPAGHRVATHFSYRGQGGAVRDYAAMLAGGYDFSSEYVTRVELIQHMPNGSKRVVRALRQRDGRTGQWYDPRVDRD
jgi:hypothetical protein